MDKARQLLRRRPSYEPIVEDNDEATAIDTGNGKRHQDRPFSNIDYWIFLLLGVSMLWAWYIIHLRLLEAAADTTS